jgi:hypothetical protein
MSSGGIARFTQLQLLGGKPGADPSHIAYSVGCSSNREGNSSSWRIRECAFDACIGGNCTGEDIRKLEYGVHVVSGILWRVYDMTQRITLGRLGQSSSLYWQVYIARHIEPISACSYSYCGCSESQFYSFTGLHSSALGFYVFPDKDFIIIICSIVYKCLWFYRSDILAYRFKHL